MRPLPLFNAAISLNKFDRATWVHANPPLAMPALQRRARVAARALALKMTA
jgi:hypothetical protein